MTKVNSSRVYFIASESLDHVKIGKTRSLPHRFCDLQRSNPDRLLLVASVVGYTYVELFFHEMFEADRIHGEWFVASLELADLIDRIQTAGPTISAELAPRQLAADGIKLIDGVPQGLPGRGRYAAQSELYPWSLSVRRKSRAHYEASE